MTFDAARKTLDDIRRELDEVAERPAPQLVAGLCIGEDEAAVDRFHQPGVERQPPAPRRAMGRGGYIIAGVIGCIAGQLALLGYLTATRCWAAPGAAGVSAPTLRVAATVNSPSASDATASEPPATPFVPPVTNPAPVADDRKPTGAPSPRLAASALRSEPRARAMESEAWVKSQEEVRAALREWLATSGFGDGSAASGTVVIPGAEGRTARTHVPTRRGGGVIIREQRWERKATGWSIVEDREARRVR